MPAAVRACAPLVTGTLIRVGLARSAMPSRTSLATSSVSRPEPLPGQSIMPPLRVQLTVPPPPVVWQLSGAGTQPPHRCPAPGGKHDRQAGSPEADHGVRLASRALGRVQILGKFPDVPSRVSEACGPHTPWPVHRAVEQHHSPTGKLSAGRVNVIDPDGKQEA
jgi:hypothetical protein